MTRLIIPAVWRGQQEPCLVPQQQRGCGPPSLCLEAPATSPEHSGLVLPEEGAPCQSTRVEIL
jgi:hypothetical protein